jgi:hypothetical protein
VAQILNLRALFLLVVVSVEPGTALVQLVVLVEVPLKALVVLLSLAKDTRVIAV